MAYNMLRMEKIAQAVNASGRKHIYLATRLGLTASQFSDRMAGRIRWTLRDAIHLAKALGVSLDELVGMDAELPFGYELTEAAR